jgi:hypothetical protein
MFTQGREHPGRCNLLLLVVLLSVLATLVLVWPAAAGCSKVQSDLLSFYDVGPYVEQLCGEELEIYGIYQDPSARNSAYVFYRCGDKNYSLKLLHFEPRAGNGWFDPQRYQFLCR